MKSHMEPQNHKTSVGQSASKPSGAQFLNLICMPTHHRNHCVMAHVSRVHGIISRTPRRLFAHVLHLLGDSPHGFAPSGISGWRLHLLTFRAYNLLRCMAQLILTSTPQSSSGRQALPLPCQGARKSVWSHWMPSKRRTGDRWCC